ncbi:MAG: hypothetical protein MR051_00500 [Lentisphaeria bacterium]|nr:hypothetical protein [Lentisphaeria bacterium]
MIQHAQWIAPAGAEKHEPCHFRVEKTLRLEQVPPTLTVQITCDGNYLLEVNGVRVGRGPARGTREIAYYDEYDVSPWLHVGENRFSVLSVCMNFPAEATQPITPAVRMAIGDLAVTDRSWSAFLCSREWPEHGPLYTPQSGYAEWRNLNFAAAPEPAETVIVPADSPLQSKEVRKRDIPLPLETLRLPADVPAAAFVPRCDLNDPEFARISTAEPHSPLPPGAETALSALASGGDADVTLPVPPEGGGITLVIDFGKEISGFAEVDLTTGNAGVAADFTYEEELYRGDRLRADHTRTNPNYKMADRCVLRAGRQQCGNVLQERGFRLIQLTLRNVTGPVVIHRVRAVDRRYPFAERGDFFCGDYQLNRLWETARETVSACTTDIFTDCPWRERLFYCNDFYIENRTALKIFGDPRIHRRAFRMIVSQHRRDGLFTSCSPSIADENCPCALDNGKTDFHVILSGDLTLTMTLRDYYLHTGDAELVRECYGQMENMLKTFAAWRDGSGVIRPPQKYWNFIDWSFELNGMGFSGKGTSLLNFLFILSARALRVLAGAAGVECFISEAELARMLEQTLRVFHSPAQGVILDTDEDPAATAAMLKSLGVPPEGPFDITRTSRLTHALAALAGADRDLCKPMADEKRLTPELYYCIFLLDAMEQTGDTAAALKLIRRHWGAMLDSGTPTLWENGVHKIGKAGFGGSASLCHGFSSAPASFLQTAVLGIVPLEPGFVRFAFAPKCPELRFARGRVPTPHGAIRCHWTARDGRITAFLHVPEACVAVTPTGEYPAGDHELAWRV